MVGAVIGGPGQGGWRLTAGARQTPIYFRARLLWGGGAYVTGDLIMLGASRIYSNSATLGGGIYVGRRAFSSFATPARCIPIPRPSAAELSRIAGPPYDERLGRGWAALTPSLGNHAVVAGGLSVTGAGTALAMAPAHPLRITQPATQAAFRCLWTATATLDGANVIGNRAIGSGAGLTLASDTLTVDNSEWHNHQRHIATGAARGNSNGGAGHWSSITRPS
jgi:hypothetical protein